MKYKKNITIYKDVHILLDSLTNGIVDILGANLVGIYLTGSLTYGDFNPESSDIDLMVILHEPASQEQLELIKKLHMQMEISYPKWARRIECSYTPVKMLHNILPPKEPRPYFNEGILYEQAPYGNEWIINLYLLYEHGISLIGPDLKTLIKLINIETVQEACIRDLFQEWQPKINDTSYLQNSYYQSYVVLNMCRILYTVLYRKVGSKKVSAQWVKNKFGSQWNNLIQTAENWHYGKEMHLQKETIEFIKFVIKIVNENRMIENQNLK